ncbi:MAG: glycerol kinase GlpK [Clostridia bacterium]|nr:glycerol kinase GlpK [Clostridia bacterium]
MSRYIMAFDAGTTSSRCIIFDQSLTPRAVAQKEFSQYFPKPGWVEHDPGEIWLTQYAVASEAMAMAGASASDIAAIGITNQRETVVVWDKYTGEPIAPAIVWQDRRTAPICDELRQQNLTESIRRKTGLVIDPYFSGTKIKWLLDHVDGARKKATKGQLLFGTIETWLIWKLTGGKRHVTDISNASRTMLYNIIEMRWDKDILDLLDIPEAMLPTVMPSSCVYGETDSSLFGESIPIAGAAGDQQAALFGQGCFSPGSAKNTYGTGCFLLMNTGDKPVFSEHGLVTTIAWNINGQTQYALEGSVFVAGSAIQWLRDEMRLLDSAADSEYFASKVKDTNGCYLVPAFTGLGAPYWDPYARGVLVGLTRGVNRFHVIRATLESLAFQTYDVIKAMEADAGAIKALQVDGGASQNNLLMQIQSDILQAEVRRPACVETTAMGAASLAGLAVGFWQNREDILKNRQDDRVFTPQITCEERDQRVRGWHRAVALTAGWAEE